MQERGMRITPCMADRLSQGCDKSDWRLFHLLSGEGVGAITAEDENLVAESHFVIKGNISTAFVRASDSRTKRQMFQYHISVSWAS